MGSKSSDVRHKQRDDGNDGNDVNDEDVTVDVEQILKQHEEQHDEHQHKLSDSHGSGDSGIGTQRTKNNNSTAFNNKQNFLNKKRKFSNHKVDDISQLEFQQWTGFLTDELQNGGESDNTNHNSSNNGNGNNNNNDVDDQFSFSTDAVQTAAAAAAAAVAVLAAGERHKNKKRKNSKHVVVDDDVVIDDEGDEVDDVAVHDVVDGDADADADGVNNNTDSHNQLNVDLAQLAKTSFGQPPIIDARTLESLGNLDHDYLRQVTEQSNEQIQNINKINGNQGTNSTINNGNDDRSIDEFTARAVEVVKAAAAAAGVTDNQETDRDITMADIQRHLSSSKHGSKQLTSTNAKTSTISKKLKSEHDDGDVEAGVENSQFMESATAAAAVAAAAAMTIQHDSVKPQKRKESKKKEGKNGQKKSKSKKNQNQLSSSSSGTSATSIKPTETTEIKKRTSSGEVENNDLKTESKHSKKNNDKSKDSGTRKPSKKTPSTNHIIGTRADLINQAIDAFNSNTDSYEDHFNEYGNAANENEIISTMNNNQVIQEQEQEQEQEEGDDHGNEEEPLSVIDTAALIEEAANRVSDWVSKQQPVSKSFSKEEISALDAFIKDYCKIHKITKEEVCKRIWSDKRKKDGFWESIQKVLPKRTRASIYKHVRRAYHVFKARGKWTEEEDKKLAELGELYQSQWKKIGLEMERMPEDCRDRWRNYVKCGQNRATNKWTEDEEDKLREVVSLLVKENSEILGKRDDEEDYEEEEEMGQGDDADVDHDVDAIMKNEKTNGDKVKRKKKKNNYNIGESLINWTIVSERMGGTRSRIQCRYKWNKLLKREANTRAKSIETEDKIWLIQQIRLLGYKDEESIDWEYLSSIHDKDIWTSIDFKLCFEKLRNGIRDFKKKTFEETLDILFNDLESYITHRGNVQKYLDNSALMSSLKAASDGIVQQVIDANRKYHEEEEEEEEDNDEEIIKMELLASSAKAVSEELHSEKREEEILQDNDDEDSEIVNEDARKSFNDELNIETEFLLANSSSSNNHSNDMKSKEKLNDDDDEDEDKETI
ncbi:hypothetical protein B5S30_g1010 [[Candida] boidinii]|nr:hypothetical protein B5S30_g1010 [[Candida] boidinii]